MEHWEDNLNENDDKIESIRIMSSTFPLSTATILDRWTKRWFQYKQRNDWELIWHFISKMTRRRCPLPNRLSIVSSLPFKSLFWWSFSGGIWMFEAMKRGRYHWDAFNPTMSLLSFEVEKCDRDSPKTIIRRWSESKLTLNCVFLFIQITGLIIVKKAEIESIGATLRRWPEKRFDWKEKHV
jgi:hypothetical protein